MFTFDSAKLQADLGNLYGKLISITRIADQAGPLMESWERIMVQDNLDGVLAGTDKDGNPAPPLSYRPLKSGAKPLTVEQRLGQRPRARRGLPAGLGNLVFRQYGLLANNNLTSSEYRRLDGPRLAPRRQFSRVITNLKSGYGQRVSDNVWRAECRWIDVVTKKGKTFLHYHFDGDGQRQYDLRGVRPAGRTKMSEALREWAKDAIRRLWQGRAAA